MGTEPPPETSTWGSRPYYPSPATDAASADSQPHPPTAPPAPAVAARNGKKCISVPITFPAETLCSPNRHPETRPVVVDILTPIRNPVGQHIPHITIPSELQHQQRPAPLAAS